MPGVPTTPTHTRRHAVIQRGSALVTSSSTEAGRFGRMFRHLPVFEQSEDHLTALAQKMVPAGPPADNPTIPAGYTYLGQFIDHDITFDPVSSLERQNDPDALHNFRTPRFDLDSLYGRGPDDQPYLYRKDLDPVPHPADAGIDMRGVSLLLGEQVDDFGDPASGGPDLPRNKPREQAGQPVFDGRALIGDPRNDENIIVSQLHLTFLRFHNKVAEHVASTTPLRGGDLFKEAQRLTRWHYQWVVVHDFLPRIVGQDVVDDILRPTDFAAGGVAPAPSVIRSRLLFYKPRRQAYMPVEFSVAAYRFGHSMIRGRYHINTFVKNARGNQGPIPIFGPERPPDELSNLNGFRRLPPQWGIEWKFYFDLGDAQALQQSLKIDSSLAGALATLPPEVATNPSSLPERNLLRSLRLGLPSGTSVARAMGITPLSAAELDLDDIDPQLSLHPPLWYYVLKEAELLAAGEQLGPVGGRIVAEVLLGLLTHDALSYIGVEPNWRPTAPLAAADGSFDMAQLISFAQAP